MEWWATANPQGGDPDGGKRASNRQRTRAALALAAVELFYDQGFDATTVDEIADRAGVSRRTLFRHFATKADIIFADHEHRLNRVQQLLDDAGDDHPTLDVVLAAAEAAVASFITPPEFFLARHRVLRATPELSYREQAYGQDYGRAISRFIAHRLGDRPDAALVADVVSASLVMVVNRSQRAWAASDGALDALGRARAGTALVRRAFSVIIDGPRRESDTGQNLNNSDPGPTFR